jgi:hypothetical protein
MSTFADTVLRGTHAARPTDNSAGTTGRLYYEMDTHQWFRDNGTGWDECDGADTAAIHDDVSGEISALAEKTSPASNDVLIIEDSADSNNKKKVRIGNLPTGEGGGGDFLVMQVFS